MRKKRHSFEAVACLLLALFVLTPVHAINRDLRVESLEVLRTDPSALRTPGGQWLLTRDEPNLDDFRASYGQEWRVRWNELTGTPHRVFGGRIPSDRIAAGLRPNGPRDKQTILALAESVVRAQREFLGADWEELRPVYVAFKGGRWIVTLKQETRGVEVVGGRLDLRFSARGDLIMLGSDIYPVPSMKSLPMLSEARAWEAARQGMPNVVGSAAGARAELVLLPMLSGEPLAPGIRKAAPRNNLSPTDLIVRPAYRVRVQTQDPAGDWMTYVDAATAQVLWRYNRVRNIAVSGSVGGEVHPNIGTDVPASVGFPHAVVFGGEAAGTVVSYDFESGTQGWSGQTPWALSGESVHSGSQAWSDSPGGSHNNNLNLRLTSPAIDISAVSDPALLFWTRVQLEDTWDFLYVEASADDGTTWKTLDALTGSLGWHEERVDLAPVAGTSQLRVRFRLFSDGSVVEDGCWIDDVSIASLGSDVTNLAGAYSLITSGADTTLSTLLRGAYVHVNNRAGSDAALSGLPDGGNLDLEWSDLNSTIAERDVYVSSNTSHDRIKAIDPGFTDLDYPLPVFVGIAFCNAYWAGSQIVMGAGAPGCADLATWPPVMYHEYGHGITDFVYRPVGDPPGDMHEGLSDYFAATISGDPRVGPDIVGPGTMFRTIDNKFRVPEDLAGQVHHDGTILAAALWDMRRNLLPDVALADSLFHFARYGFPMSFEDYYLELLMVDDDDANLGNGTPHITAIQSAFGFHGIGLGPGFQHVEVVVQDAAGNGDGRLDPGETADLLLTFHNYGAAESEVSARITTSTPGVTILVDSVFVGNAAGFADLTAPTSFTVQLADTLPVGTAILFDLELRASSGFNGDCFMLPVGYVPILLVDDDRMRTLEGFFYDGLDRLSKRYTRWEAGSLGGPPAEVMSQYRAVIWFTGNDRSTTIAQGDRDEIASYLAAGGNLFITGEDIGADLTSGADLTFYQTWLHATLNVEDEGGNGAPPGLVGVAGDLIGDGLSMTLNGGSSANNQGSPSSINPQGGAVPVLRYSNGRVAALRFEGGYKLLYCAFGFEGITNETDRDSLMSRTLSWLCPDESGLPNVTVVSPNGGEVLSSNSMTTIEWTAQDSIAVLTVDILLSTDGGLNYTVIGSALPNSFSYEWMVDDVNSVDCLIRVEAVDPSSNVGFDVSDEVFTITSSTDLAGAGLPGAFALHPALPNPFNPRTTLRFDLPRTASVRLQILSVDGRRVRTLLSGETLAAGRLERVWNGRDDAGRAVATGVYLVHLRADDFEQTQKVQLLK